VPAAVLLLVALPARAVDEEPPTTEEVQRQWRTRMEGRHFTSRVRMTVELDGKREERRLLIFRDDVGERRERLYARFESPPELRDLAILYIENPERANDYFMYQPATGRIRRISDSVARQDIYGVDFEYLGFGLAQFEPIEVEEVERTELEGRPMLRIRERATRWNPRFDTRINWVDPTTLVLMRTEHHRDGRRRLIVRTEEVGSMEGIAFARRVVFERPDAHEVVTMEVESLDLVSRIPPDVFSTLQLIK
jgi:hypothetical protein